MNAGAPNDNDVLSWDTATSRWIAVAPSGGAAAFLDLTDVDEADYTGHAGQFVVVNGDEDALVFAASSVAAHDVLSLSHGDTLASAVSRGSLIYGNSTPKWAELPIGNAGDVLTSNGTGRSLGCPIGRFFPRHAISYAHRFDSLCGIKGFGYHRRFNTEVG
ncbi:MAG: hypothetical protein MZV70_36145 [Desulfobacterales bacterium]|nr:hypothetical protein [Desulfobacterales bacterium]